MILVAEVVVAKVKILDFIILNLSVEVFLGQDNRATKEAFNFVPEVFDDFHDFYNVDFFVFVNC